MKSFLLLLVTASLLVGCSALTPPTPTITPTATSTATQAVTLPPPTRKPLKPSATPTLTPTPDLAASATPTWVEQGPDQVKVPILLFHHIAVSPIGSRYYVPPDKFEADLKLLRDWGYTTISVSSLVEAITRGAELPPHPILITFDDGNEDNYINAFPIMKKYGFTGVLYVVVRYIDTPNYLTTAQIQEMAGAGWEVGSHSETHRDLVDTPDTLRFEIVQSRKDLEDKLGVPILSFAYPFGDAGDAPADYVHFAGYIAAMGATGFTWDQGTSNLYVLQRCEIKGSDNVKSMTRFLPWIGDPAFLPTDTPTSTPTASRTPIPTYTQYPTSTRKPSPTP